MEASRIMIFYSELLALDNFLFTDSFSYHNLLMKGLFQ